MCDWTPVRNWLIGLLAAIVVAGATAMGAALINATFYFWLAFAGLLVAAALTAAALLICGQAIDALNAFCACAGPRCAGACNNLRNTLNAARVVLGIQATACLAAAGISLGPGAGVAPALVIAGSLFIQAALIVAAIFFVSDLSKCQTATTTPTSPPTTTTTTPPTTTGPPVGAGPIG